MTYRVTSEFYRMFGIGSMEELPELPKYKLDENEQIVLEEFQENKPNEAPMPEREEIEDNQEEIKEEE